MTTERRVAIVTGAGHGIGRAIALALAGCGARLVLNGRDAERLQATADHLATRRVDVVTCPGDVRQSSTADALARTALEHWDRIDILVNNAGVNVIKPTLELSNDEWQAVLDTDLSAPFFCSRAVAPAMIERHGGCIINIGSILSTTAFPRRAAYASAKHGLIGLTRALASEWGPHNVRVNAILPGMVPLPDKDRSPMQVSDDDLLLRTPLRRFGRPEEIGSLVCYLASDEASFISGAAIPIDGAWTADGGLP